MTNKQQLLGCLNNNLQKAVNQWKENEDNIKTKITWIDNFLPDDYANKLYKHFPYWSY